MLEKNVNLNVLSHQYLSIDPKKIATPIVNTYRLIQKNRQYLLIDPKKSSIPIDWSKKKIPID